MKRLLPFVFLFILILAGCHSNTLNAPLYQGRALTIGVIGEAPIVRESNVNFTAATFDELLVSTSLSSKYDAVFIMKEQLPEAAQKQYAKVYKSAGVPFFFIEPETVIIAFTNEDISYEDFPNSNAGYYAEGFFQKGEKGTQYEFGLYNDTKNEMNIKSFYSDLFRNIESLRNGHDI